MTTAASPGDPGLTRLLWGLFLHTGAGSPRVWVGCRWLPVTFHCLPQNDASCTTEPKEVPLPADHPNQHKPKPVGFINSSTESLAANLKKWQQQNKISMGLLCQLRPESWLEELPQGASSISSAETGHSWYFMPSAKYSSGFPWLHLNSL